MEKLAIIGAGVAGLTAGVYGRLNGYDVELYEMHTQPGGECTGWSRGGYYFDGCLHWLMGTKPGEPLNGIWRQVGALGDDVPVLHNEELYRVEMDGRTAVIYTDTDRLEEHLTRLSPQDGARVRRMCRAIRAFRRLEMPVDKPFDMFSLADGLRMGAKMLPLMGYLREYGAVNIGQFADGFQDPLLRRALRGLIPEQHQAMALLSTLASLSTGDSGYPAGGSLALSRRMEARLLALGGAVRYGARVERVLVEGGRAVGVRLADGSECRADVVISCADGHATLNRLLEGKYTPPEMAALYEDSAAYPVSTSVQVSFGVACDLAARPLLTMVRADRPVDAGGVVHEFVGLKNSAFDPAQVTPGRGVVTVVLTADFDWWREKHADREAYAAEKQRVAAEVRAVLETRYPETRGKIKVVDVATPMTYVRYCDAWRGSWMSWMNTPGAKVRYLTGVLPGLERFYMAGQWTMPPGGLPTAALTGRWVIQRLCRAERREFTAAR